MYFRRLIVALVIIVMGVTLLDMPVGHSIDTGSVSGYAPSSTGNGDSRRFTIVLDDAELKETLHFLARVAGLNIMIPEEITGVVNVNFDNVRVMDAINSIVRANDLDYAVERSVLRIGKTGQFSATGEDLKTETIRLKFATAKDLTGKVKTLLTDRGAVLADERTNSLVVRERIANIENVKRFISDIDIRDAQILIEARILEVTREFKRDLGIQWGINTAANRANVVGINAVGQSDGNRNLSVNMPAANPTSGIGLLIGTLAGGTNIDIQITAAEKKGDARTISQPSIVTSNGVPARIRSGETLLIKTTGDLNIGTATTTGDTGLHQINTGVQLTVTPQISGENFIKLKIAAETSRADFSRQVDNIPVIMDNTASTEVLVLNGQTTVIGGLSKFTGSQTNRDVPFFSKIPILGNLFKSRSRSKTNTELMIFIRPIVIRPLDELQLNNAEFERTEALKQTTMVEPIDRKKRQKRDAQFEAEGADTRSRARRRNPHLRYRFNDY